MPGPEPRGDRRIPRPADVSVQASGWMDSAAKRCLDVALASLALVLLAPLLLVVAAILRFTGEREVFYRQTRIGTGGEPFHILKFATMLKDSPNLPGGDITGHRDPRVLPVGRILRRTKINELPQLLNVVAGDMSLIGPRPLTPRIYDRFPDAYKEAIRPLRPGLSGIGSIVFRDEERLLAGSENRESLYMSVIQPYKAELEIWYACHRSVWLDVKLIVLTLLAVAGWSRNPARFLPSLPPPPPDLRESMNE